MQINDLGKTQTTRYVSVCSGCEGNLSGETVDIPLVWSHQGKILDRGGLESDFEDHVNFS